MFGGFTPKGISCQADIYKVLDRTEEFSPLSILSFIMRVTTFPVPLPPQEVGFLQDKMLSAT